MLSQLNTIKITQYKTPVKLKNKYIVMTTTVITKTLQNVASRSNELFNKVCCLFVYGH